MLTKNVWQSKGLYNGALGTVWGIVFGDDVRPPSQPICVLIEFDDYCGPSLVPQRRIVPVVSEIVAFDSQYGKTGSRQQLPLVLGWAMTIHKSQGLTLNHVVLGIGIKELAFGITYVGCSRVKSYKGLAFQMSFPWERMEKVNRAKGMQAVRLEIARLNCLTN